MRTTRIMSPMIAFLGALLLGGCGIFAPDASFQGERGPDICEAGACADASGDAGDVAEPDAADVSGDTDDASGDADACEPLTECAAGQCGAVDDGCGGEVVCEAACVCDEGTPIEERCGPCGLGRVQCDSGAAGACVLPPGLGELSDEDCARRVLYVDSAAPAGGAGTPQAPFNTWADAAAIAPAGVVVVVAAEQGAPLTEPIELVSGVHVIGGYDGAWLFNPAARAAVQVPAQAGADVFGVRAERLTERTVVYGLSVKTADAPPERTNYGLYVHQTDVLEVHFSDIKAGRGGDGVPGDDGANGNPGGDGEDAADAIARWTGQDGLPGGEAGVNAACPAAKGGKGGRGGYKRQGGDVPGGKGGDTAAADGGEGGREILGGEGGGDGRNAPDRGDFRQNGQAGESVGEVVAGLWQPLGDGEAGLPGADGVGGGGGGGALFTDEYPGSGGGGGGAGGCGGAPGTGGTGGGGSFGLFAVDADPVVLRGSSFGASSGGLGGAAGLGGFGGLGGIGGSSTDETVVLAPPNTGTKATLPWSSGSGGDGGDGSGGGHGGGGAGGVSYGAFCERADIDRDEVVSLLAGPSAQGGRSAADEGDEGDTADVKGCSL